jgi:toxin CcdB
MPVIQIQGEDFIVETPKIGSVPTRILKNRVCSLSEKQNLITAALDFLFQGY